MQNLNQYWKSFIEKMKMFKFAYLLRSIWLQRAKDAFQFSTIISYCQTISVRMLMQVQRDKSERRPFLQWIFILGFYLYITCLFIRLVIR